MNTFLSCDSYGGGVKCEFHVYMGRSIEQQQIARESYPFLELQKRESRGISMDHEHSDEDRTIRKRKREVAVGFTRLGKRAKHRTSNQPEAEKPTHEFKKAPLGI